MGYCQRPRSILIEKINVEGWQKVCCHKLYGVHRMCDWEEDDDDEEAVWHDGLREGEHTNVSRNSLRIFILLASGNMTKRLKRPAFIEKLQSKLAQPKGLLANTLPV